MSGLPGDRTKKSAQAFRHPERSAIVRRIAETVAWGARTRDKVLIAAYYGLLTAWSAMHLRPLMNGMYPEFWLGDVSANTALGRFECRRGTTDFDIVNPHYEPALVQAMRERLSSVRRESHIFVDIGAHIGKYAVLAGRLLRNRGTVIAIEADPENFRILRRNVAINELRNVRCFNVGCWDVEGRLTLHHARGNLGGHSFVESRGGDSIDVPVTTLDSILQEQGIEHVDTIKIDVERGEFQVLQGARSSLEANRNVIVFFEESGDPTSSTAVRFLINLGFHVRRLDGITYLSTRNSGE